MVNADRRCHVTYSRIHLMQQEPPTRNYLVPRSSSGSQQDFQILLKLEWETHFDPTTSRDDSTGIGCSLDLMCAKSDRCHHVLSLTLQNFLCSEESQTSSVLRTLHLYDLYWSQQALLLLLAFYPMVNEDRHYRAM